LAFKLFLPAESFGMATGIIVTTGDGIPGRSVVEHLGVVCGVAVRLPKVGDSLQALGNMGGGGQAATTSFYEELCMAARAQAHEKMVEWARQLGADAVIAMRYTSTTIGGAVVEILAYGTAVKLAP
jgi:uncharacterized protein YbjQ (UPF0145 family)